jgi:acyl carrier protein
VVSSKIQRNEVLEAVFVSAKRLRQRNGKSRQFAPQRFDENTRLDELGVDSISVAEIVDDLETQFDMELPFDELLMVESVDQFVDVIIRNEAA